MPRVRGDGKRVYITRKQMHPVLLSESEWNDIFEQSQIIAASRPIPEKLCNDLNDAITVYTKHGLNSLEAVPARELIAKVNAWLNRTDNLSNQLSKVTKDRRNASAAARHHDAPKRILEKYFEKSRFDTDRLTADDLAYMMKGVSKLGRSMLQRVGKTSARRIEPIDFWLLWGALLISILRKHKIG